MIRPADVPALAVLLYQRLAGRRMHRWQTVPFLLAVGTALLGAGFTPAAGTQRSALASLCVVTFLAASAAHAAIWRPRRWTALWLISACGGGLLVEILGLSSGKPFGEYVYTGDVGWRLLGVPVIVPLAWTMMAYPAFVVGWRISQDPVRGLVAAVACLVAWDLVIDPVMVQAGWWAWSGASPSWSGVPLTNFAGWSLTAAGLLWPLWRWRPDSRRDQIDDRVPIGLYAGIGIWSVWEAIAAGAADAALAGGTAMGVLTWLAVRPRQPEAGRSGHAVLDSALINPAHDVWPEA